MNWQPVVSLQKTLENLLLIRHLARSYARKSHKFIDAYYKGLDGKQAAWASKKYHGHHLLPESLMDYFLRANL